MSAADAPLWLAGCDVCGGVVEERLSAAGSHVQVWGFDAVERRTDCDSQAFGSTLDRLKEGPTVEPHNSSDRTATPDRLVLDPNQPIQNYRRGISACLFSALFLKNHFPKFPTRKNESGSKDAGQAHCRQRLCDGAG